MKLADGQQRIVTLNNLIKAIHDVASEKNIQIDNIELFDIKYDVFSNQKKYETHFFNYVTAPFKKVYLDFYEFVKSNTAKINNLIKTIKNNIFVYIKKCSNADNAFDIFQQINTGGKPLSKDEVIKTALDQYSLAYQIKFDTSKMKEVRQSLISFYKLKSQNYDKNFDNMEIITFLREYVTKDKKTYQDFVDTIQLLNSIGNNPIKYVINYINRNTLTDVLNIMAMKGVNININHNYLLNVMVPLCLMSIVLTLNSGSPTTYRYLLNEIVADIKCETSAEKINKKLIDKINLDTITWQININDFITKLGDPTTSRGIKKALLILDVICKNISGTVNVNAINLEHIYPQNPDVEWARNGWPTHREKQKAIIDNIGNYLLLCEEVNKSIQNQYITNKVSKYKEIIARDILLQTPINTIDFSRFTSEQDKYIESRTIVIAREIQTSLPLGRVLIKN
ncbi:MAG: DUF262 domain-containing protein [Clostridia bacterium]|nr:DUF262 domain-containing protein [Clostridia bacterium]